MLEAEFLALILDSPGDDNLRLAWADWLDGPGADPARARLVRVQLEQNRLVRELGVCKRSKGCPCARCQLGRTANSIIFANVPRWIAGESAVASAEFDRGMVVSITLALLDDYHYMARNLRDGHPLASFTASDVEAVHLSGTSPAGWYMRVRPSPDVHDHSELPGWIRRWLPPGVTLSHLAASSAQQNQRVTINSHYGSKLYGSGDACEKALDRAIKGYADTLPAPA